MIRRLRLVSGLVLFAYVCTHFANHALGLISLDAMERGRIWFLALWRNPVGTPVLYGALALHLSLTLWKLYESRGFRMPRLKTCQIVLGLAIPPLLAEHIAGTRYLSEFFGVHDTYTYVLLVLWKFAPMIGVRQVFVLLIVWLHGCIGLHYWLRIRPWYPRALPWLYAAALLLPVLALLGFVQAGREVLELADNAEWLTVALGEINFPGPDSIDAETTLLVWLRGGFAVLLVGVLAARGVRAGLERRRGAIR
ncbi:MAG: hypothetical protein ACE5H8_10100 [Alphaproteobacteria bacterium]